MPAACASIAIICRSRTRATAKSSKLFVVSKGYPLEVVVAVEGWVKVRDANGAFAWIEAKQLTDKRMVMVKVPLAVEEPKRLPVMPEIAVEPDVPS